MTLAGLLNLGIILVGLAIVALGLLLCRGRRRSKEPTCSKCGYALTGLPGIEREGEAYEPVACPECGHAVTRWITLFRRQRKPVWLALVAVGIAVLCEPLFFGHAYDVYDHLPDSAIVYLYSEWDDTYAGWVVQDRIGSHVRSVQPPFSDAHMRSLAEGALQRIERCNARHRGDPGRVDVLDLHILWLHDARASDVDASTFSARVARAMPPLFAHPDDEAMFYAAVLACDRNAPASTMPAAMRAKDDSDPRVREAAAASLFMYLSLGPPATEAYVALLDDPEPEVRTMAAVLLFREGPDAQLHPSLGPLLEALTPNGTAVQRARWMGLMSSLQGDDRRAAIVQILREAHDGIRWDAMEIISRNPDLIAALLPEWGKEKRGGIESWLQAQRHRPIDEVLEELGFE